MLEMDCPHCGKHLEIPDQYAGQQGTCIHCQQPIVAPLAMSADFDTPAYTVQDLENLDIDPDRRVGARPSPGAARKPAAAATGGGFLGTNASYWVLWLLWAGVLGAAAVNQSIPAYGLWLLGWLLMLFDARARDVETGRLVLWGILGFVFYLLVMPVYLLSVRENDEVEGSVGRAFAGMGIGCLGIIIASIIMIAVVGTAAYTELLQQGTPAGYTQPAPPPQGGVTGY